jgi:galactose-1-phosphate uridylyltransferase
MDIDELSRLSSPENVLVKDLDTNKQ